MNYFDRPNGTEMAAACTVDLEDFEICPRESSRFSQHEGEARAGAMSPGELPWYAIRIRSRWEKIVAGALRSKGYDEFLPLYRKRTRWSDRVQEVDLPLFPGYVFCRSDLSGRPPLVTTPGVIGILGFGGSPAIISPLEIERVKAVIRSGASAGPWPYLCEGQRVRILGGALTGVEGILIRAKGDWRVVLSVAALGRSIAVEVDRDLAMPIS
jgi:transcription antitermination factor NusG